MRALRVLFFFVFITKSIIVPCLSSKVHVGLRQLDEGDIPQGASTLAFVFDVTGSMHDDLVQVIDGAAKILNTILARGEKTIYNYVLVPFHDPDIGPVTETTDPDVFQAHLRELYVHGGRDCPEMSVGAIKKALEVCLPNSHIYVFTDASAKDYYLLNDVLKLIQKKQSQVVFVMTGDCGNNSHPGYQAYERIASTSSGQVFHLRKSDVNEVLNFVRVSLQARKVNLFAVDRNKGEAKEFIFEVDGSLREFTISVSGERPQLNIINSRGEIVDHRIGMTKLLSHNNISVVNIKDPIPGTWKLRVGSDGPHTIRATGLSNIDFVHGFSRQPTANLRETYHRPLKGVPTYLLVNGTELPPPATFQFVKLINLEGYNVENIPLHRFPNSNLFNASTFFPPNDYFYLKIAGVDEFGYPIERITSTAISPQLPDVPEVDMRPRMVAYYDEDVDIRCYIQSLVPFSVAWYKEGFPISQIEHYPQTTEILLTVPEVNAVSEGWYSCNATNLAGSSSTSLFLDVKEPPPVITKAGNASGIVGKQTELICDVYSIYEHNVTWSKLSKTEIIEGVVRSTPVRNNVRFMPHPNGSLIINRLTKEDEGWFVCTATNEGGTVSEDVYLNAYYLPTVKVTPSVKNFIVGQHIEVSCTAAGIPPPVIHWKWTNSHKDAFFSGRSQIIGNRLIITSAEPEDEGKYTCVAKNDAGKATAHVLLNFIEIPLISLPDKELLVRNGDQAILRCIAEGIPDPVVSWYKGDTPIYPLSYVQLSEDGSLIIFGVQEVDAGSYTCVATSEAGKSNATMLLSVGSKPTVIPLPRNISIDIGQNGSLPCIATGTPKPQISWLLPNEKSNAQNKRFHITPQGHMHIQNVDISDQGKYTCVAENKFGTEEQIIELFVSGIKKPVISPFPITTHVQLDQNKLLNCLILEGNPKPTVRWYQNSKEIESRGNMKLFKNGTLKIFKAQEDHEAHYKCVATNIGGSATEETFLNLQVSPFFSTPSNKVEAVVGSSVSINCEVKGDPKPEITWNRNGFQVASNSEFQIAPEGRLTIASVKEVHAGEYQCVARNIVGRSKELFHLSVLVPPNITQVTYDFKVIEGEMVTLPCRTHAIPPANIKWKRKDAQFANDSLAEHILNTGSLQLHMVKLNDSGTYICEAINSVGQAESSVNLTVLAPPKVSISSSEPITIKKGQNLQLKCISSGNPKPSIHWERDGKIVVSSSTDRTSNISTLNILNIQLNERGQYSCNANNSVGSAVDSVHVDVYEQPHIETNIEADISAVLGEEVTVPCKASGYPDPVIRWKKHDDFGFHQVQDGVLQIPYLQENDGGFYTCTATNLAGNDTLTFEVLVHVPPIFLSEPLSHEVEAVQGSSIFLNCLVTAYPLPRVLWYKNGIELLNFDNLSMTQDDNGQKLVLHKVTLSQNGLYSCRVLNIAGEAMRTFSVSILVPPITMTSSPQSVEAKEGELLELNCSIDGTPQPHITWRKNRQLLSVHSYPGLQVSTDRRVLKYHHSRKLDAGHYTCIALNKVGSTNMEFEVSVLVRPIIQGDIYEEKDGMVHDVVHLFCYATGIPQPQIIWYKNNAQLAIQFWDKVLLTENNQKLSFLEISEEDKGLYSCVASNSVGEARKDVKLSVLVPPFVEQDDIETETRPKEGGEFILNCEAFGTPQPRILWAKDDKMIDSNSLHFTTSDDNHKLFVKDVLKSDGGRYSCLAMNKAGSVEKNFIVNVLTPPRVDGYVKTSKPITEVAKKEVIENWPIHLFCDASGNPLPRITWRKNGELLTSITHPHIAMFDHNKQLKIDQSLSHHSGIYICIAENEAGKTQKEFDVDVLVPPNIKGFRENTVHVIENNSAILNCSATGNPIPTVHWVKDGAEINLYNQDISFSSDLFALNLMAARFYHTGHYVCIATNIAGSKEKDFNVNVLVAPSFDFVNTNFKPNTSIQVNRPITFECPVTAFPQPEIKWMKDGIFLDTSIETNFYIHSGSKKLTVLSARAVDAGFYTCVASNEAGENVLSFNLDVLVPPAFNQNEMKKHYNVKEGDETTIKCTSSGNPVPSITWLKNSNIILSDSSKHIIFSEDFQHLSIKSSTVKDAGKYTCIAGNELGTIEQDFKLAVQVPPKFDHPENEINTFTTILNKPTTLHCPVSGVPPPSIKWFKNGVLINPQYGDGTVTISADGKNLKILRSRISDAATYICRAVNVAGKTEKEFVLGVQVPPSISENDILDLTSDDIKQLQGSFKAVENQSVVLECYVDGSPQPVIIWLKDGHLLLLSANGPFQILHEGQQLKITNVKRSNTGRYTCIASNIAGTTEKNFFVEVHAPPILMSDNDEIQSVQLHRSAVLQCDVDAQPPASFVWLKDGEIIDFSQYPSLQSLDDGAKLQLLNVDLSDDARFTCIASNDAGFVHKDFRLNIQAPPILLNYSTQPYVQEGETVTLFCHSFGNPTPAISWMWNNIILTDELSNDMGIFYENSKQILHIYNITSKFTGKFKCVASNNIGSTDKNFDLFVKVPPRIIKASDPIISAVIYEPIEFHCLVEAIPPAEVTWHKEGELIRSSPFIHILNKGQSLQIFSLQEEHNGTYTCSASNFVDKVHHEITLNVQVPPRIQTLDHETTLITVSEGSQVQMQCFASGNPSPGIKWYQDGEIIITNRGGRSRTSDNEQVLFLQDINQNDVGEYTCKARNNISIAEKKFNLVVQSAPEIMASSEANLVVNVNSPLTINCEAKGVANPVISWMKNGQLVNPFTDPNLHVLINGSLRIPFTTLDDSGRYNCIATNAAGKDEREFDVTVQVPSYIDKSSSLPNITVISNRSMILECVAFGVPPPSYHWMKDDEVVSFHPRFSRYQILEGGKILTAPIVTKTDEGRYTCIVDNAAGSDAMNYFVHVIVAPKLESNKTVKELKSIQGVNAIITCPIANPESLLTLRWSKNDDILDSNTMLPHFAFLNDHKQLKIMKVQASDDGTYRCYASNLAGETSYEILLSVIVPAKITYPMEKVTAISVNEHQSVALECNVQGIPQPQIQWLKNQDILSTQPKISYPFYGKLRISDVTTNEGGSYSCHAENDGGSDERFYSLTINVPPSINISPRAMHQSGLRNAEATLNCSANGIPTPRILWYKDSQMLISSQRYFLQDDGMTLKIKKLMTSDSGKYICMAVNDAGISEAEYFLAVNVPPVIENIGVRDEENIILNQPVRLFCDAIGVPTPNITWFKNGVPFKSYGHLSHYELSAGGRFMDIKNVKSSDAALYTCHAENVVGKVEGDYMLQVSVPPDVPLSDAPISHQILIGNPFRVQCPANGTPLPTITWLKNGYPLVETDGVRLLDNNYALWLSSVLETDAAEYTCVAFNNAGSTEYSFNLTILVPPTFTSSESVHLAVVEGHNFHIKCQASGLPKPDIVWLRNGEVLASGNNIKVDDKDLYLVPADLYHSGTFSCEASNVAGKSGKNFQVTVMVPPDIDDNGSQQFITSISNEELKLNCSSTGIPEVSIMWLKDGHPVLQDVKSNIKLDFNGKVLSIQQTKRSDSGLYKCIASNIAGNTSKSLSVVILDRPIVLKGPGSVKANLGSQVILECNANGFPQPEVTWLKNGQTFLNVNTFSNSSSFPLLLNNLELEDAGNYSCIAQNEAGISSCSTMLSVLTPPTIEKKILNVKVFYGESAVLPCNSNGHPPPTIMWLKDNSVIHSNKDFAIQANNSLYIPSTSFTSHSGSYTCIAENEAGNAEAVRKLVVLKSPAISNSFVEDYIVSVAQTVLLNCETSGIPPPTIGWEKNGYSLDYSNPRFKMLPQGTLQISLVQPSDMGNYICIAKSEAGDDSRMAKLVVWVPPNIKKSIVDANILTVKGRIVEIPCQVDGFPAPHINWQLDGDSVPSASVVKPDGTLVIADIKAEHSGNYVCIALNSAGRDYLSVNVQVNVPPAITVFPKSQDVSVGDSLSLVCGAIGIPVPVLSWFLNNTEIKGHASSHHGRSELKIENAGRLDEGTYACLARNSAGERKAVAAVRVRMPPVVLDSFGVRKAHQKDSVILDCTIYGDPVPDIIWLKNGQKLQLDQRIQQAKNGSLMIHNSLDQDAGQYKCIARNDYGSAEAVAELVIRSPPSFVITPLNATVKLGSNVNLDCKVEGEPKPSVTWSHNGEAFNNSNRSYEYTNNTLRIVAIQLSDEGQYFCHANNSLGAVVISAYITVKVDGMWSLWSEWSSCSTSCGDGLQVRQRFCNNPFPRNGGKACLGVSLEKKLCSDLNCPVDGEWGNWLEWESCSASCGTGKRNRHRFCNNPSPQFNGKECVDSFSETVLCSLKSCPVDGDWGNWSEWLPCSVTCGNGSQIRIRECNNPPPSYNGKSCVGKEKDIRECNTLECRINGEWGSWSDWSYCSSSCGGGTKQRNRLCDSPVPSFGGRDCIGSYNQVTYCNNSPCPVNGEWASWTPWGECSASCNKGLRKRFRTCSNPSPSGGGRECTGPSQEVKICNSHSCPVHGMWTEWNDWSSCSVTCGSGTRKRFRFCDNPEPQFDGKDCVGENVEAEKCGDSTCEVIPTQSFGHFIGAINGFDIGPSRITANISRIGVERIVTAKIDNIPEEFVPWMKLLVPMASPIYWTTALEVGKAVNGYTLTKGSFSYETDVDFGTGEILYISHVARGVDNKGNLLIDTVMSGEIPNYFQATEILVHPYDEDYLQLGPHSIYAFSTHTYSMDEYVLPYFWNHSIFYENSKKKMPYMVEKLTVNGIDSLYDFENEEMSFILSASITKGSPEDECPDGFQSDKHGPFCKDIDECTILEPCSHMCSNYPGAYTCRCPGGFVLDTDGHTCNDVNECETNTSDCRNDQECRNTIGSFECIIICDEGFERTEDKLFCRDIDECSENRTLCSHNCINTIGSYYCNCSSGYYLIGKSHCVDIDECEHPEPPCSHICVNIPGSFFCVCPDGFDLLNERVCKDIDECVLKSFTCPPHHICENTEGSYKCIKPCAEGLSYAANGTCIDINECNEGEAACHSTQICVNTFGSYQCFCPKGFYSEGTGKPCRDINECEGKGTCQHICQNTIGSYHCICPTGYRLGTSGNTCEDIDECVEQNINCGSDKMCFNMKGSFDCVDTPCPPNYERDSLTRYCKLPCKDSNIVCPQGVKYAEVLAFKMVALTSGINAYQDLVRLVAYDQDGAFLPNTLFFLIENETGVPFRISLENGKGVLYSQKDMNPNQEYKIKVKALSYDSDNQTILYTTKFVVYISVSKYPY